MRDRAGREGVLFVAQRPSNVLGGQRKREREFVCWLLNAPATCECISGTDLHGQFYVLPH